jgi:hypothetical protein
MQSPAAYLIVVCDNATNAVLSADIWSDPPWEKSRSIGLRAYVAYSVSGRSYSEARDRLLGDIRQEWSECKWLVPYLEARNLPMVSDGG